MSRVIRILHGWIYWKFFCLLHHISYESVVLVLSNENMKLDENAVRYLNLFMDRKNAENAIILWDKEQTKKMLECMILPEKCKNIRLASRRVELLYDYYCFDKFFENIVFTYTSKPQENMLGRVLDETEIDEKDAVCLALYHLRYVPE